MSYAINAVQQTADGKLNLRLYDPVTKDSFSVASPTVQPNFPAVIIVRTRTRIVVKRRLYG